MDFMNLFYFGEYDCNFILSLIMRFLMNGIFVYILVCKIFAKEHRLREYSFSFVVSNILIFMVTSLLASVKIKTGFAFGLFAILSILRYRAEQINIREMTFLFAAIILGVLNSLATEELSILSILLANILLLLSVWICEKKFLGKTEQILLVYDNTALLAKDKQKELFDDLRTRFGYEPVKVVIVKMNYLIDSAQIKLVYKLK